MNGAGLDAGDIHRADSHIWNDSAADGREEKGYVARFIPSISAWLPAETLNGMRWCNPHAHTGTRTHAFSPPSPSLYLSPSLSPVPSRQLCEKWIRQELGDGATPPLFSPLLSFSSPPALLGAAAASQGSPLIIQTREWCSAHRIGRISLLCLTHYTRARTYTHRY